MPGRAVVTGAFSFYGAAIARELSRRGWAVRTLTNRRPPPGAGAIPAAPLRFDPEHLARALAGADLFVNTYWIRLPRGRATFAAAIANSRALIAAAAAAGVGRLVHVSVTNAAPDSPLGYYRGKAEVDALVRASGLPHAIVRPTLIVGPNDVLTSNIAWCLRRFPLFPLPGGGRFRLQPVTLADAARIAADAGEATADLDLDAAGPDALSFADYVRAIAAACGLRRRLVAVPPWLALAGLGALAPLLRDTVLAREELAGLAAELLVSRRPPLGREPVPAWIAAHAASLGLAYVNDRRRHFGSGSSSPIASPLID